ncbi:uncharacterized protein Dwil_GK14697 [Drosophila willistoni]|uniref:Nucleoside diphosphate kinase n=1 Tax=Drosophila willistoni TaxID=7260 RepID=B4NPQ9_DROWI|nr:nucleoside diphosphate kinase 6 [Drosophila willistoni]EDW86499.1 uncharacterized protein Dwil_GK14697 [Drosophila willistoni]
MEITLALLKPHVLRNTFALNQIKTLIGNNFEVLEAKEVQITKELSERFYAEHKGKFFYHRLTSFMNSGPCYALILQAEAGIQKWRQLMGPTKVFQAVYTEPQSIRGMYGLSDTRNACHGSDSKASALREISIIFPEYNMEKEKLHPKANLTN